VAWIEVLLAELALGRGDVQAATGLRAPARAFFASRSDPFAASVLAFIDANAALLVGDYASAECHWAAGVAGGLKSGSNSYVALCHVQLSNLAENRGDYAHAARELEEAMRATAGMGFLGRQSITILAQLANL
jgi:hypothetical protein